eukprot:6211044-Pleurochrysis_carterae.AAC.1
MGDNGHPWAVPCLMLNFLLKKPFDITCRCGGFCYERVRDEADLIIRDELSGECSTAIILMRPFAKPFG